MKLSENAKIYELKSIFAEAKEKEAKEKEEMAQKVCGDLISRAVDAAQKGKSSSVSFLTEEKAQLIQLIGDKISDEGIGWAFDKKTSRITLYGWKYV